MSVDLDEVISHSVGTFVELNPQGSTKSEPLPEIDNVSFLEEEWKNELEVKSMFVWPFLLIFYALIELFFFNMCCYSNFYSLGWFNGRGYLGGFNQRNLIRMAVILSQPMPSLVYFASKLFSKSSIILVLVFLALIYCFTISISPLELSTYLYQIPSHPMRMNSSPFYLLNSLISGLQVIICLS